MQLSEEMRGLRRDLAPGAINDVGTTTSTRDTRSILHINHDEIQVFPAALLRAQV